MPSQQNVFILMLENHSFDNIFGLSGIPGINGLTGNETNSYNNQAYPVGKPAPDSMPSDPGHEFMDTLQQLCGNSNLTPLWNYGGPYPPAGNTITNAGFVANYATSATESTEFAPAPPPIGDIGDVMLCFDTANQLPVSYQLATEFAICDNWFSSLPGPTWPNRFFAYAASSGSLDDSPTTEQMADWEAPWGGYSFPNGSVFELLENNNYEYNLYQDNYSWLSFPIVQALSGIEYSDMNDLGSFADDLNSGNYNYPLTVIEPNYGDFILGTYEGGSSQHPMDGMQNGEALIKTVYEAIRNSPLWENSILIITYDEHGGFYDHVPPPVAPPPNDGASGYSVNGFDFSRYGVRVPAIVVSPYIPKNTVSKQLYDHSSMLNTVEENWGLPNLTNRDQQANSLNSLLSLAIPRTDCPTVLNMPAVSPDISRAALSAEKLALEEMIPLPGSGNIIGFLQIANKVEYELSGRTEPEKAMIANNLKNVKTKGDARRYIDSVLTKLKLAKNMY